MENKKYSPLKSNIKSHAKLSTTDTLSLDRNVFGDNEKLFI